MKLFALNAGIVTKTAGMRKVYELTWKVYTAKSLNMPQNQNYQMLQNTLNTNVMFVKKISEMLGNWEDTRKMNMQRSAIEDIAAILQTKKENTVHRTHGEPD